jgi:MoxR-like ATPase
MPVLAHRLVLTADAELSQRPPSSVVDEVLSATPAPTASVGAT